MRLSGRKCRGSWLLSVAWLSASPGSAYVSDRDVAFLEGLNLRASAGLYFFYLLPYIATSDARTCQI